MTAVIGRRYKQKPFICFNLKTVMGVTANHAKYTNEGP